MTDADVIIVGAGPTGLMLAVELGLAGVQPLVLDRLPQPREIQKAGGLSGQILDVLRYRGLLERFEAASTAPTPALRLPLGGMHLDFTRLADAPMDLLPLPQPRARGRLAELAGELGAEIRRGQEVVGLSQDDDSVTADVRGSDGQPRVTARYLVGCDGARSRVRDLAGIPFPGITYPEVQRLAQATVPESVTRARERRHRGRRGGPDPRSVSHEPSAASSPMGRPTPRSWASTPARRRPPTTTTTSR